MHHIKKPYSIPHHSMRPFIDINGPTLFQGRDVAYLLGFFFGFKKKETRMETKSIDKRRL
jgi:hypothetical protein